MSTLRIPTGSELYEEILDEMRLSYNLSRAELERVIDSQFRVIRDTMSKREGKVVQLIYIGKFRPTVHNKDYHSKLIEEARNDGKTSGDIIRLEERNLGESRDREESSE